MPPFTLMPERDRLIIYIDHDDKECLRELATSKGMSISTFVRTEVIGRIPELKAMLENVPELDVKDIIDGE